VTEADLCPACDEEDCCCRECCIDAAESGESHYHCAKCGRVTGMLGHWVEAEGGFKCPTS